MNALARSTESPSETLPLFPEAALELCNQAETALLGTTNAAGQQPETRAVRQAGKRSRQRRRDQFEANPHLAAAKRLSRKIRYLPDHSEAQSETAHAICEHLRLMLSETMESANRRSS